MLLTDYLTEHDMSLRLAAEPTNADYQCFNTGGVEVQVGEFLFGLVRMIRPEFIFETGTHLGISSAYMGLALRDNKYGILTTCEIFKDNIEKSEALWKRLGINDYILADRERSLDYELDYDVDLLFLDSEPDVRFKELRRFYPRVKKGGYIFIHDTPRNLCQGNFNSDHPHLKSWPFGDMLPEIKEWVRLGELTPFTFGTPRGLTGFYKVHDDDYRWPNE